MNLEVKLAGVTFKNPVTTASGTFGSGAEYEEFVDLSALGAVTTKGVANVPWEGNPTPRIAETYGGMLNAVGSERCLRRGLSPRKSTVRLIQCSWQNTALFSAHYSLKSVDFTAF